MNVEYSSLPAGVGLSDENPWPGLLPFGEDDWRFFHGREFESEMLVRRVERERLTILFAPSGLGKSSILQAGLFPRLRRENVFPVYIRLDYSSDKPNLIAQVKNAVVQATAHARVEAPEPLAKETLWEYFHRSEVEFWSPRHQVLRPLLVFDQFEEVFTLGERDPSRSQATNAFITELADLVEGRPPVQLKSRLEMESPNQEKSEAELFTFDRHRYKVLLALREDFLPDLEGLGERMGRIAHNRFRLGRMNGVAALQVVNQAPQIIAPDVAESIVRFVAAAKKDEELVDLEVEPALLSVVCQELNSQRQERREPRITGEMVEGSQEQVLHDFYERSIADLSESVCTFVEEKLLTRRGFRNLVVYDEALSVPGVTKDDIEELVRRRLVRVEERGRLQLLELTHDLLTGVVTTSRDERRRRLREATVVREVEERHRKSLKTAAVLFLVFVLAVGALGSLAWAYFAQQQADALAAAKEAAENAAAEASEQRGIAEAERREAERQQREAEETRELAEQAAAEASRLKFIADAQREEAVLQRQGAVSARADAESAAEEARLQRNLADRQRSLAEERQTEIEESEKQVQETNNALVEALRIRLSSSDPGEVVGALDILVRGSQDSNAVLARVDERWFASAREFVPLLVALDALRREPSRERQRELRTLLVKRFCEEAGYTPPPKSAAALRRVSFAGGAFDLGMTADEGGWQVRVSRFSIQRNEVTNAQYRRFDPKYDPEAPDDHPVTRVSWYEAMAYAAWLGGHLPTEAQWEFAARGPSGRPYPWGERAPSAATANFNLNRAQDGGTRPVGSFAAGATPEGLNDMAGNVWEWCQDGSRPTRQNTTPVDPMGPLTTNTRVLKGGSYFNDERYLLAARRNFLHPEAKESVVGFRVAWQESP
ncbi:MAG: hypothetical protein E2P02_16080 [Acidobacteria bacterium]|nr:MAG: hypothetical protein E2P02_16080 [Acidobacteriota bacterium]